MINEISANKMKELLENEEFAARMQAVENPEEIPALLAQMGVDIPADEFLAAYEQEMADEELNADDLDAVNGGCAHTAARYLALAKLCMKKGQWSRAAAYLARAVVEAARPCRYW